MPSKSMPLDFKTKHKKSGFNNDKVHVYCRRLQKQSNYDMSPIVDDLEWLARYVIARKLQAYIQDEDRKDLVQHLLLAAVKCLSKFPWENKLGSKDPAFAYFSIVMYNAGVGFLGRKWKYKNVSEQAPESSLAEDESVFDKPVEESPLPKLYQEDCMQALLKHSQQSWLGILSQDKKLGKMLRKVANTGLADTVTQSSQMNRYYQAIVILTVDPESFPEDEDELDSEFKVLALLIGERKARQAQFLLRNLNGDIHFKMENN